MRASETQASTPKVFTNSREIRDRSVLLVFVFLSFFLSLFFLFSVSLGRRARPIGKQRERDDSSLAPRRGERAPRASVAAARARTAVSSRETRAEKGVGEPVMIPCNFVQLHSSQKAQYNLDAFGTHRRIASPASFPSSRHFSTRRRATHTHTHTRAEKARRNSSSSVRQGNAARGSGTGDARFLHRDFRNF